MNERFFLYKSYYSTTNDVDLSFIPMMTRRKLSQLAKITLSALYKCYENEPVNLVFASRFGEFNRLTQLIEQHNELNEVSPIAFSASVHNASVGIFSLLNNIRNKYNAISAGENTLSNGLVETFTEKETSIFCYADTIPESKSLSILLGKEKREDAECIEIILQENICDNNEFKRFIKFLNKETHEFIAPYYILRRVDE